VLIQPFHAIKKYAGSQQGIPACLPAAELCEQKQDYFRRLAAVSEQNGLAEIERIASAQLTH
jgi:hypothetical protein